MTSNLWSENSVKKFWKCDELIDDELWKQAIQLALPKLQLPNLGMAEDELLEQVLGEAQFGDGHWELGKIKSLYYSLKPFIPRFVRYAARQILQKKHSTDFSLNWPIEERYVVFQFEVLKNILELTGNTDIKFKPFWPDGKRFSFVLTHDIEEKAGHDFVREIADLEESIGFRSSFNFVPERYHIDKRLIAELRERGFEIGIHGLKHDGKLFSSREEFLRRAERINHYLQEYGAIGFRSPLTHRNPYWMQALNIDYDLSFFDTDPYEPMSGGVMCIHPFFIGHFVELPYTLVQDSTLAFVLGDLTPKLWLEKVEFIEKYQGMALMNSHPDYLRKPAVFNMYRDFLSSMKARNNYWHALPHQVSSWWRDRSISSVENGQVRSSAHLTKIGGQLEIDVTQQI